MKWIVAFLEIILARLKASHQLVEAEHAAETTASAELARRAQEEHDKKLLAHYAATVAAWYTTKMEHDKSLLTLSTAAVGVLITVITKFAIATSMEMGVLAAALLAFIVCLVSVLAVYKRNCTHLVNVIRNDEPIDKWLTVLDWISLISFVSGIILASTLGILMAIDSLKETNVAGNDKKGPIAYNDSLNKAMSTRPAPIDPISKSFNQAGSMKPQASGTPPAAAPPPPSPPAASGGGSSTNKPK